MNFTTTICEYDHLTTAAACGQCDFQIQTKIINFPSLFSLFCLPNVYNLKNLKLRS